MIELFLCLLIFNFLQIIALQLAFSEFKFFSSYWELCKLALLLFDLIFYLFLLGFLYNHLALKLLISQHLLCVLNDPVLQVLNIYVLLLVAFLLPIYLFLFVRFGFLHKCTELFLSSLGYLLFLFIFSFQHLYLAILLQILWLHLHQLFHSVCLPLAVFLTFFLHLLHQDYFLCLHPLYLTLESLYFHLLCRALLLHSLLLPFFLLGET